VESFRGPAYHPARWPHTPVDFTGKRIGIIGNGATAIQAIPEIAKQAQQLTVFQRPMPDISDSAMRIFARGGSLSFDIVRSIASAECGQVPSRCG
jgi:cation diffusion facilitator CzcD-associated flavoprotein CzcO